MNVRAFLEKDIEKVRKLHERFYPDLNFPDFLNGFLCSFALTDNNDEIIMAGGVRPVGEVILVTDKEKSEIQIGRALVEAMRVSLFIGSKFNLDELVAFVKNNESYASHLVRHGFYPRSPAFALKVPKWEATTRETTT
jgi:hypothetical protein